jgi:PAS domain S-box-containing protein
MVDLVYELFEMADAGLGILDADLRVVRVNEAFAQHTALRREEHRGRTLETVVPTLAPALTPLARSVVETGRPSGPTELLGATENEKWSVNLWPLSGDGRVLGVGFRMHRTASDGTEAALRRNEARFHAICDACPVGILLTDDKGTALYANATSCAQMGRTLDEALGDGWERAVHPEDRDRLRNGYLAATRSRNDYRGIHRYLHRDGRVVLVNVSATGIYDRDRLIGYVAMTEDVTERAAAEAALRESELRFRELAENIRSVFWLRAADRSRLYYLSPAFSEIWGRPVEEAMKRPDSFAESVHPDDRARVGAHMRKPLVTSDEYEYRIVRPDGSVAWILDRRFPVRDDSGEVVRVAGIATDVTTQKALEARLLAAEKLDSIGRLAGGVAHDFNNLLTVVMNQGMMARRACEAGETPVEELSLILEAARQGADVTRQLLTFARRQPFDPALLDVNVLADAIAKFLTRLLGERIELSVSLSPEIGIVRADRAQLEQVIVNLALNARDAMPDGGRLSIRTKNVDVAATSPERPVGPGRWVVISVEDTGLGIAKADLPHIFEPFFSTKPVGEGTGLGLATCYGILEQHGGRLVVDSTVGKGTTFELYFPRLDGEVALDGAPDERAPRHGTETILVVEDEPSVRKTTVRSLRLHGFEVVQAKDAAEALEVLASENCHVDLVITDIVMPGMDGIELGAIIRERHPNVRVLYTSGYPHGRDDGTRAAPTPFLAKPYLPSVLMRLVREVLDASTTSR